MGRMADACYLMKHLLNTSRGPAVRALRAQTDKVEYSRVMRRVLEEQEGLEIREVCWDTWRRGTVSQLLCTCCSGSLLFGAEVQGKY